MYDYHQPPSRLRTAAVLTGVILGIIVYLIQNYH